MAPVTVVGFPQAADAAVKTALKTFEIDESMRDNIAAEVSTSLSVYLGSPI